MWRPPTPLRFGSTKRSEFFHIGLVKSTTASSRPNIGLFSRRPGPQQSQSHASSSGESRRTSRAAKSWRYSSGRRFSAFTIVSET
jgi:hypothetical protein